MHSTSRIGVDGILTCSYFTLSQSMLSREGGRVCDRKEYVLSCCNCSCCLLSSHFHSLHRLIPFTIEILSPTTIIIQVCWNHRLLRLWYTSQSHLGVHGRMVAPTNHPSHRLPNHRDTNGYAKSWCVGIIVEYHEYQGRGRILQGN